ncbi:MAG: HAMP domain-containing protein [Planctomycetes bacterium]|nr:HAMP domain-containing protein [Planctomycetota bacterium]
MRFLLSLKTRLLATFVVCALLTGIAGGIGVVAMRDSDAALTSLGDGISRNLTARAEADADQRRLLQDTARVLAGRTLPAQDLESHPAEARELLRVLAANEDARRREEAALKQAQSTAKQALDGSDLAVTALALELEQNLQQAIQDGIAALEKQGTSSDEELGKQISDLGAASSRALDAVVAALTLRAQAGELELVIVRGLAQRDADSALYATRDVETRSDNLLATAGQVSSAEARAELESGITAVRATALKLLNAHIATLKGRPAEATADGGAMATQLAAIRSAASTLADDAQFEALLAMEDAVKAISTYRKADRKDVTARIEAMSRGFLEAVTLTSAGMAVKHATGRMRGALDVAAVAPDDASLDAAAASFRAAREETNALLPLLSGSEAGQRAAKALAPAAGAADTVVAVRRELLLAQTRQAAQRGAIDAHVVQRQEALAGEGEALLATTAGDVQRTSGANRGWSILLMAVSGAALLLALGIGVLVSRAVFRPVGLLVGRLRDISEGEGDLTQRVPEAARNELGELGRCFNRFVVQIESTVREVRGNADSVTATCAEAAENASRVAHASGEQATAVDQISAAMEQIRSTTEQTAANTRSADKHSKEAIEVVERANGAIDELNLALDRILESSRQTRDVVQTIHEIAFQTNLLALNAAVESARAGDAGRGFAVVAAEVSNLAQRAAAAASGSGKLISTAVAAAENGKSLSDRVRDVLEEVNRTSGSVDQIVREIANGSTEQIRGIQHIATAIQSLEQTARQTAEAGASGNTLAADMNQQAAAVTAQLAKFRVGAAPARQPRDPRKQARRVLPDHEPEPAGQPLLSAN